MLDVRTVVAFAQGHEGCDRDGIHVRAEVWREALDHPLRAHVLVERCVHVGGFELRREPLDHGAEAPFVGAGERGVHARVPELLDTVGAYLQARRVVCIGGERAGGDEGDREEREGDGVGEASVHDVGGEVCVRVRERGAAVCGRFSRLPEVHLLFVVRVRGLVVLLVELTKIDRPVIGGVRDAPVPTLGLGRAEHAEGAHESELHGSDRRALRLVLRVLLIEDVLDLAGDRHGQVAGKSLVRLVLSRRAPVIRVTGEIKFWLFRQNEGSLVASNSSALACVQCAYSRRLS